VISASEAISDRDRFIEGIYEQEYESLRRLSFLIVGDSEIADDLVMEAFARVLPKWKIMKRFDWPGGYVRKTVINLSRRAVRRRRLEDLGTLRVLRATSPEASIDEAIDIRSALQQVSFAQRTCLVLRYLEGRSEAEMADLLDLPARTIKSQLSRGRKKLREVMTTPQKGD
jgi:RNA polymerase sigma factor (sigma-70 family)